jgi:hypothetical protein
MKKRWKSQKFSTEIIRCLLLGFALLAMMALLGLTNKERAWGAMLPVGTAPVAVPTVALAPDGDLKSHLPLASN